MNPQTESVLVQNLCVPCGCRCRYCLLSWDGKLPGVDWERGIAFARRFRDSLARSRPELLVQFAYGPSMDHPDLPGALAALRDLGSPQAAYWQCDGMRLRSETECEALTGLLAREGVKQMNFTFYGLEDYHDGFAARPGDFQGNLRLMRAAKQSGLVVSAGIPLTLESAPQAERLTELLRPLCQRMFLFIPHEEGRGRALAPIRMTADALAALPPELRKLLNPSLFRSEEAWLREGFLPEQRRSLLLSLRPDNLAHCEQTEPSELVRELEALDEAYYAAFPPPEELAARCGDPKGQGLYRQRDLLLRYRRRDAAERGLRVYDVTDERQSGSRRY